MSAHEHHDAAHGAPHGDRRGYLTGFLLSVLLTAVPFGLVMGGVIADQRITAGIVTALAAVQIVVHMIYFLHMNARAENGWSLMALMFTLVILVIVLAGTLWVMINMNHYMMPPMVDRPAAHAMDMSGM